MMLLMHRCRVIEAVLDIRHQELEPSVCARVQQVGGACQSRCARVDLREA